MQGCQDLYVAFAWADTNQNYNQINNVQNDNFKNCDQDNDNFLLLCKGIIIVIMSI